MAGDIVLQLRDTRYPGQLEMRIEAAEIIEQYRADSESDLQTNNELRADRDALAKALREIQNLGAKGETAARLGNIAHVALLVLGSPVGQARSSDK